MFIITFLILLEKSNLMLSILYSDNLASVPFYTFKELNDPKLFRVFTHSSLLLIILSLAFLFKEKNRMNFYIGINTLFSILLLVDLWCARSIGNFFTLRSIFNNKTLSTIIDFYKYFKPIDIIFILDIILLILLYSKGKIIANHRRNIPLFIMVLFLSISAAVLLHKIIDKDKKVADLGFNIQYWEPFGTIYDRSPLGYILFDAYDALMGNNKINLEKEDVIEINQWLIDNKENLPSNEYEGIFKGKNLIVLQLESFESFMINQSTDSQEITPYLNSILKNSLYFPNFYEHINHGVSSDADLMTNTGLLPLKDKSTFWGNPYTEYISLPKILSKEGYNSLLLHGERGGNWNFKIAAENIGFHKVLDKNSIEFLEEEKNCHYGVSDRTIFSTFLDNIFNLSQPFYGAAVTVNSHAPFDYIPKEKWRLNLPKTLENTAMEKYLQSSNYLDGDIEYFLKELDNRGLLENSIVVIYGDHTGIHKYNNDEIPNLNPSMPWWNEDFPKIPLIIYSKDFHGEVIDTIGGQVDVMPTLAYTLGVPEEEYNTSSVGKVLVNTKKNYTLLKDGTIVGSLGEDEKVHALKVHNICHKIIKGNYFKVKDSILK